MYILKKGLKYGWSLFHRTNLFLGWAQFHVFQKALKNARDSKWGNSIKN